MSEALPAGAHMPGQGAWQVTRLGSQVALAASEKMSCGVRSVRKVSERAEESGFSHTSRVVLQA